MKINNKVTKGPTLMGLFLQKGWTLMAQKSPKESDLNGFLLSKRSDPNLFCSKSGIFQPIISFSSPSKTSLGLLNQSKLPIYPIWHSTNQVANSPQML